MNFKTKISFFKNLISFIFFFLHSNKGPECGGKSLPKLCFSSEDLGSKTLQAANYYFV